MGDGGRVTGVKIKKADGTIEIIPADLVLRAIGYRGAPLPGVPFDQARGVIPNAAGRVLDAAGAWVPGTYVAGWAKHGARGLIGAQRLDAQATAKAMLEDAAAGRFTSPLAKSARAVVDLLEARNARFITIDDWRRIDAMEKAAGAAAGKPRVKFESTAAALEALKSSPEAALPATPRSIQGPIYAEENGALRPLSYNPALPTVPLWKEAWRWIAHSPAKIRVVRSYMARVREHLEEITDDDLRWSLNRFRLLENQEGILRQGNRELVNNWKQWTGSSLRNVGPDDFNGASLSRTSLRKIFKQAMDREEPTRAYQYTAAMNLHNYMPRVSHFMGVSMQERVIAVALRGRAPARSVWAMEEERHGNIIETVYNLSREPGQPELREQGIAPTSPKPGEYSARSMIANRALAEIGAASGYLLLKSNARKGSPADLALEGIFRDEVYHYALMDAARKWGLGLRTRWARLRNIIRHNFDNPLPEAVDAVIHERSGFSPLTVFQVIYAFYHVDKRVDRFLRTVPDEEGRSLVGKVYQNEGEVRSAIARG
ncbi:MAG: hypothetical protein KGL04_10135, partial [Elusimicrobia bacterium]|nr:hypothetical protein [Elusimicrobiota bacterium]